MDTLTSIIATHPSGIGGREVEIKKKIRTTVVHTSDSGIEHGRVKIYFSAAICRHYTESVYILTKSHFKRAKETDAWEGKSLDQCFIAVSVSVGI